MLPSDTHNSDDRIPSRLARARTARVELTETDLQRILAALNRDFEFDLAKRFDLVLAHLHEAGCHHE